MSYWTFITFAKDAKLVEATRTIAEFSHNKFRSGLKKIGYSERTM